MLGTQASVFVAAVSAVLATPSQAQHQIERQFPVPREGAAIAYEPISGHGYLFGGSGRNDLYRHADGLWVPVATVTTAPNMSSPVAATWQGHGMLVVGNSETWLFNGTDWSQLPVSTPYVKAMAFDPQRARMVARGVATHEFDGTTWSQVGSTPSGNGPMAWHANLQRVLYAKSVSNFREYYAWDGAAWSLLGPTGGTSNTAAMAPTPWGDVVSIGGFDFPFYYGGVRYWPTGTGPSLPRQVVPPHRVGAAWYDPIQQVTVLTHALAPNSDVRSTWQLDQNNAWHAGIGPQPGFWGATIAYDSWRGETILCGAQVANGFDDGKLWRYRDERWTSIPSGIGSQFTGSAFDSVRGRLVVFGGDTFDYGGGHWVGYGVFREWDGTNWQTPPPGTLPPGRRVPLMAFDANRQRTLLYGGVSGSTTSVQLTDTWQWDGLAWQQFTPATQPPAGSNLTYDPTRGACVLSTATSLFDWDGLDWNALPIPWSGGALAFDPTRMQLVRASTTGTDAWNGVTWQAIGTGDGYTVGLSSFNLAAGAFVSYGAIGTTRLGDPAAATLAPFGSGCAGSNGVPLLHGEIPPRIGHSLPLRCERLPPGAAWFGVLGPDVPTWSGQPLPIDLSQFGMPGCALAVAVEAHALLFSPDWQIAVPSLPALLGAACVTQAFVLDPPANALGLSISNPLRLRVGG